MKPQNPQNQEHFEAEIANSRSIIKKTLSKADQKKEVAIKKATDLLLKANIPFFLVPILPQENGQDRALTACCSSPVFDKTGKLDSNYSLFKIIGAVAGSLNMLIYDEYCEIMEENGCDLDDPDSIREYTEELTQGAMMEFFSDMEEGDED